MTLEPSFDSEECPGAYVLAGGSVVHCEASRGHPRFHVCELTYRWTDDTPSEVASLTAERDRLRAELEAARQDHQSTFQSAREVVDKLTAERDAALASLADEQKRTAQMAAVVEAAKAWRETHRDHEASGWYGRITDLIAAVDALDAATAGGDTQTSQPLAAFTAAERDHLYAQISALSTQLAEARVQLATATLSPFVSTLNIRHTP